MPAGVSGFQDTKLKGVSSRKTYVTFAVFAITSEAKRARVAGNCMAVFRASYVWKTGISGACRNDDITITACEANIATAGVVIYKVRTNPFKKELKEKMLSNILII